MNLTIDIGNSSIKVGVFHFEEGKYPGRNVSSPISTTRIGFDELETFDTFLNSYSINACILSTTSKIPQWLYSTLKSHNINFIKELNASDNLPIKNRYKTPSTLGTDRIASVVGGYYLACKNNPVLCVDLGTAITYDFITADGEYLGGNISPGLSIRFKSLHDYTSKLPLLDKTGDIPDLGYNTSTAIRSGVILGLKNELQGYIDEYQSKYPDLYIFLTGGDALYFDYPTKKRIFVEENLVLKGLNIILHYILSKK